MTSIRGLETIHSLDHFDDMLDGFDWDRLHLFAGKNSLSQSYKILMREMTDACELHSHAKLVGCLYDFGIAY